MHIADTMQNESGPALTILPATAEHVSHIIMLAHRIWPVSYKDILTAEQIDNMLLRIYTPENLREEITKGHQFWLAYLGNKPVGYASAYKDGDVVWIKKVYVDPAMQGQRIGVKLMHKAVSAFLPAKEIRLLANPKNVPAHNFYLRLGFSKIGEVPVQMGDWNFNDFLFSMPIVADR
jgi:ribosomal protein S18 acetylase RimI-like enzyme